MMVEYVGIDEFYLKSMSRNVAELVPADASFFITGGTGIIGKWLVGFLTYLKTTTHKDISLSVLSRDPSKFKKKYPETNWVNMFKGDIVNEINAPCKKYDYFIHGATDVIKKNTFSEILDVNVLGTKNALNFAEKCNVKSFQLLSSGAVYGNQKCSELGFNENDISLIDHTNSNCAYSLGKQIAEALVLNFGPEGKIKNKSICRLFANYGPHVPLDSHFAISNFVNDLVSGADKLNIIGNGLTIRSYLHLQDLVGAIIKVLMAENKVIDVFNIGSSKKISIFELASKVIEISDRKLEIEVMGENIENAHSNIYFPNTDNFENSFGQIDNVSFEKGLIRYIDWAKNTR